MIKFHSIQPTLFQMFFIQKKLVMWLWCVRVVNKACRQPLSSFSPFPAPIQRPGQTGSKRRERRRRRNEAEFERNDDGSPPRASLIFVKHQQKQARTHDSQKAAQFPPLFRIDQA